MNRPSNSVRATIVFSRETGWAFPLAWPSNPLVFWSWIRFERDRQFLSGVWTLLIELEASPRLGDDSVSAMVWLLSPKAPHEWLMSGQKFDLVSGDGENPIVKASGTIAPVGDREIKGGEIKGDRSIQDALSSPAPSSTTC